MTGTPAVELAGVSKWFGSTRALDQVSWRVEPGEVVGLIGANGAGKTTALRVLAGLIRPSEGTARVNGIDVGERPLEARRQLGFLTASTGVYERLTGREVVTMFCQLAGVSAAESHARVERLTTELDLKGFIDRRCGGLSSGQRQRISVARALAADPSVYVLDEPTAALDPLASRDILDLVRRGQATGKAVIFSTHRMEEVEHLCSRVVFLREGRVVATGTTRALLDQAQASSLTGAFLHFARGAA